MIFVTVGAQMPFDRLIRAVDEWVKHRGSDAADVFAQIGASKWSPQHVEWVSFLDPPQFRRKYQEADVIVAHAGTGTILTAMELGKPILVMPRRAELLETRNDHQLATVNRFESITGISVAWNEDELKKKLDTVDSLPVVSSAGRYASAQLIDELRQFLNLSPSHDDE